MNTIFIDGQKHMVAKFLEGFEFKETPESTNVIILGANFTTNEFAVVFKNGSQYLYSEVPKEVLTEGMAAQSAGKFVAQNMVRKFPSTKVADLFFVCTTK